MTIPPSSARELAHLGGQTMGTTWSVKLVVARAHDLHRLHAGIQQQLDQVVAEMSTWEPDSAISRYNRADAGSWHRLPAGFDEVMRIAIEIAEASAGAFDPTIGALVALWGFGAHAGPRRPPEPAQIEAARTRSHWSRLQRRHAANQWLQPGGVELDLSGIAKGYGVERVRRYLCAHDVASALIEVGGELAGYGRKPDHQPWRVLIEAAPEDTDTALSPRLLDLDGLAVATSGDRWHHYEDGGRRYSHTLDPRLGRPVEHAAASVTVIAADATRADAWATAFSVLGGETSIALADKLGLAVRFLERHGGGLRERFSAAFSDHLSDPR